MLIHSLLNDVTAFTEVDITGDGTVNFEDFGEFAGKWLTGDE